MKGMNDNKIFPPHLNEPLRRKIAIKYVQQEMRKLLPKLRGKSLWQSIDNQIVGWYKTLSIRNFWNAVHGISMGFRLNSLVPWITSRNIKWKEDDILVKEIHFGGKLPRIYSKSKAFKTAPREHFPIFVLVKKGKMIVIDGNTRLSKAISENKKMIRAFVGEPIGSPALFEHWVPTSILVELIFWHNQQYQLGRKTTNAIATVIADLIQDSSVGRLEFVQRSIRIEDKSHKILLEAVSKILKNRSIKLK